jgi:hypothetical protein
MVIRNKTGILLGIASKQPKNIYGVKNSCYKMIDFSSLPVIFQNQL